MRRVGDIALCVALFGLLLGASAIGLTGYRINMSASMPRGLWHVSPVPKQLARGMIVVFCMEDPMAALALERHYLSPGPCPSGAEPLLKPVVAAAGDIVGVTPSGISVNGSLLKDSKPFPLDPAGRPLSSMPDGEYRVADEDVWLLSHYTPLSFDSRYYGPVPADRITGVAYPVLTTHSKPGD